MKPDVIAETVLGYRVVKVYDIVHGLTARTRGLGGKIVCGLQSIVGGEVSAFTKKIDKAEDEALKHLMEQDREIGANAVVEVDFETTEVFESVVLVAAHGTAVTIEPE